MFFVFLLHEQLLRLDAGQGASIEDQTDDMFSLTRREAMPCLSVSSIRTGHQNGLTIVSRELNARAQVIVQRQL